MEFLTVKETAQLLRVSAITVRRYIASGQLAAERVGRGIRVRREAIEEFITPVMPDQFYWPRKPAAYDEEELAEISSRSSPTGVMWVLVDRLDDYIDEHVPITNDPLGNIVGMARSGEPTNISEHKHEYIADAYMSELHGPEDDDDSDNLDVKPFTMDDPLWSVFGTGDSEDPTEVAENKYDYLADAYLSDQG